ncbi:amidohydrolase family protein [Bordetella bronchialis]|uniref:2-pyrone-4,6-dicarboxylate hydrolase n=1 Tax=Bordetella bronchialis TaxID=463025 RepID=A0ABM6CW06_9BORD|nr:amidohydrolase family protein [Bordetella bronchialis]ANN67392.1 2-pyrone-4,6-dicarboxylate hydrolase [Bordetella bronchialis]
MQYSMDIPADACDSHLHIFDPRFAEQPGNGAPFRDGTVRDYRAVAARMGTRRAVIVQAKRYGTDNACLLDAVAQFHGQARGIAVVAPGVDDATLRALDAGGVRGLRFSVWNPADTVMTVDMIDTLARRIAGLGWHAQLHMSGDQVVAHAAMLARLPCPVVFDHMARLPPGLGVRHPAWGIVRGLIDRGRCWVKLSGAYLNTLRGGPDYPDAGAVARAFVQAAPQRLVWGSDWPHVTERPHVPPDTVRLLALLAQWAPDAAVRHRILVDNPRELYGFD